MSTHFEDLRRLLVKIILCFATRVNVYVVLVVIRIRYAARRIEVSAGRLQVVVHPLVM